MNWEMDENLQPPFTKKGVFGITKNSETAVAGKAYNDMLLKQIRLESRKFELEIRTGFGEIKP